jgi:hypothetical protein
MKLKFVLKIWRLIPWLGIGILALLVGCSIQWGAEIQWDSKDQILVSEDSQVKLRSLQTRVFDTKDKKQVMQAVIQLMQDFFFKIDVLDPELGLVSGKKLIQNKNNWANDPTYYKYNTDSLIIFSTNYRTFGPFQYRNDLIRLTVTVRPREENQLIVRASAQHNIRAIEDPEVYQSFFKTLNQSLFLSKELE